MDSLILSPPVAATILFALVYGVYRIGGLIGARGERTPDKHQPYTGGERPVPVPPGLGYHAFFRLALLFAVLHVAALVISTLPQSARSHRLALVYLVGIGISVLALTGREE